MDRRISIRAHVALACSVLLAACSDPLSSQAPLQDQPAEPGQVLVADPAGRMVVAEVDGVPVYEDCVATQAAALGPSPSAAPEAVRQAALEECIHFELLAQQAAKRGLASDPEVAWTRKTEVVRRLIDADFVARFPDPDSMDRALLEQAYQELRSQYVRPEIRHTAHAWVPLEENEPEGSPRDQAAEALARELYQALKDERDLPADELFRVADELAGEREIKHEGPFRFARASRLAESFIEATFALPEPGMVSSPVRSHVGWHVILLTRIDPEVNVSLEEAKPELFEVQRRRQFMVWLSQLTQSARIQIDEDSLARLQKAEEQERFAQPVSP